jgi:integrase/recombinase XerD
MSDQITIKLIPSVHRGSDVVFIDFPYSEEIIKIVKQAGCRWSQSNRKWYVERKPGVQNELFNAFGQVAFVDYSMLKNTSETENINAAPQEKIQQEVVQSIQFTEKKPDFRKINYLSKETVKIFIIDEKTMEIYFPFNKMVVQRIKEIPYAKWEANRRCWIIPYHENLIHAINKAFADHGLTAVYQEIKTEKKELQKRDFAITRKCPAEYLDKLKVKRYSKSTIGTYTGMFTDFINFYSNKSLDDISEQDIKDYLLYLIDRRGVSSSYQNQAVNAIKFYYEKVKGGERTVYMIDRPRSEHKLPVVLSFDEVKRILDATRNLKHKCILMTLYSAGLRISELLRLKLNDLDYDQMKIHVKDAKGNKDRFTILSGKLVEMLKDYFSAYKPTEYLFEGAGGKPYSDTSAESVFHRSCKYAGITKDVSLHTLRHSFATHMLEKGADIRYIQYLLGHASAKTTQIYTHITAKGMDKIKSPLDDMNF